MQFSRQEAETKGDGLEAYERLIRDAMAGDHTLFTTAEGIERLWEISDDLIESPPPVEIYPRGSWGPHSIHDLIGRTPGACRSRAAGAAKRPGLPCRSSPCCRWS